MITVELGLMMASVNPVKQIKSATKNSCKSFRILVKISSGTSGCVYQDDPIEIDR